MRLAYLVATGALALVAIPAFAGNHTITARNSPGGVHFDPATLTIAAGDSVTFMNDPVHPGFHNVRSDDDAITSFRCAAGCDGDGAGGVGDASGDAWQATVVFPIAGSVGFYCEIHGGTGGSGMSGVITITSSATSPSISAAPVSISASAEAGAATASAFAIANSGTADLTWTADSTSASCTSPVAIPWLSLTPPSGSVATGAASANVDVTLDAANLAVGVYTANICVHSNDAAHDPLALPVEFTVNTPDLIFTDGFDG